MIRFDTFWPTTRQSRFLVEQADRKRKDLNMTRAQITRFALHYVLANMTPQDIRDILLEHKYLDM